ncbi:hypothetical protein SBY92_004629 [Candida maltosa Xu316]
MDNDSNLEGINADVVSPLLSNNTTLLGGIKTDTPIDLTIDNSIIQPQPQVEDNVPFNDESNIVIDNEVIPEITETIKQEEAQPEEPEDVMIMDIPDEDAEEEKDPIQKMRSMEILPDLYNLMYDLNNKDNTKVTAKDFDKYLGSLRLKLNNLKNLMQQVDGIGEDLTNTMGKIETLQKNNYSKQNFLADFKAKVNSTL